MKIVGNSYPIHDAAEKAAGTAIYAGDMRLKGMVYAALIRSTIANGYVRDMDFSTAGQMPGVVGWITCLEDCGEPYCRYRTVKGQITDEKENVWNRRVRFIGDRIGCILAKTAEEARQATSKVKVIYDEYPPLLTPEESVSDQASCVHSNGNVSEEIIVEVGQQHDVESICVDTETILSRINHVALEPHVCTADYNRHTGQLTIWSPNQSVHGLRTVIGDIFKLPYHKVRVIKTIMGGSFGGKQEWIAEPAAAAAAIYWQGPVQLVLSREEVFQSTICRAPMYLKAKGIYDNNGKIVSFQLDNTLDAGAYMGNSKDYCGAIANKFFRCYKYSHMKYTGRAVLTNTPVSGAFRGWTSPEFAICMEHNINMAARKLEIDPLDLRLINVALPGDMDVRIQESLGEIRLKECLELGQKCFQWKRKREDDARFNKVGGRFRRGSAVACGGHLNGYFPRVNDFTEIGMRMTETGNVIANATLHDHGCGTVQLFRMIIAQVLDILPEMISIGEGDTAVTPFDYGCLSSRSTYVIGRAAQECALSLLNRLKLVVNRLYGVPEEALVLSNGSLNFDNRSWTFSRIVQESHSRLQEEISVVFQHINKTNPGVGGAHFAHVQVDTALGNTKILEYLAVHDIGKAINPEMCRGQIQGAVMMGASAALKEQVTIDSKGVSLGSLRKYHMLNLSEAPEIEVRFIEDGCTDGPFGCKSIGEVCHVPPAAAIVGAVNEALWADMCQIPLSQDRICSWLEKNRKDQP